ncbi:MAG: DUF1778 domain-containing protein [Anaerolineae bacterium]
MLLRIRCSRAEADTIRHAAKQERRGISQFVIAALFDHIKQQPRIDMSLRPLAAIRKIH